MSRRDNDFSSVTRRRIAERAGHVCSFPGCGNGTTGPSPTDPDASLLNGWACHIYPASATGPRSNEIPSDLDLTSDENAVWMCETHGSLIDKQAGQNYRPSVLLKWKQNAETAAALKQQSALAVTPRLDALVFPAQIVNGRQYADMRVELSRLTVIESNDESPLRLISSCVTLAATAPSRLSTVVNGGAIDFTIFYSPGYRAPSRVALEKGWLRYWDGIHPRDSISGFYESVLVDLDSVRSMLPTERELEMEPEERDHDRILTGSANPDPLIAEKVAESLKHQDTIVVRDIRRSREGWEVNTSNHKPGQYFAIGNLSGSETISLHLDLAMAALRLRGDAPLILIIDNLLYNYDREHLQRFDRVCRGLPENVQIIVTDSSRSVGEKLAWHTETLRH